MSDNRKRDVTFFKYDSLHTQGDKNIWVECRIKGLVTQFGSKLFIPKCGGKISPLKDLGSFSW